jgi:predicted phosphodiesterase
MITGQRLGIMADVHGEHRTLEQVLERCSQQDVDRIILLGDLFDRVEQITACLQLLTEWQVSGVIGNHEREALRQTPHRPPGAERIISELHEALYVEDALFLHDQLDCQHMNGSRPHVVFAGHTHVRMATDDTGPLDLSLGQITIRKHRRYVINPGAVTDGQFAIWDRRSSIVRFERV